MYLDGTSGNAGYMNAIESSDTMTSYEIVDAYYRDGRSMTINKYIAGAGKVAGVSGMPHTPRIQQILDGIFEDPRSFTPKKYIGLK
jgi:hypothetical protein